jgi:hypothetical protein
MGHSLNGGEQQPFHDSSVCLLTACKLFTGWIWAAALPWQHSLHSDSFARLFFGWRLEAAVLFSVMTAYQSYTLYMMQVRCCRFILYSDSLPVIYTTKVRSCRSLLCCDSLPVKYMMKVRSWRTLPYSDSLLDHICTYMMKVRTRTRTRTAQRKNNTFRLRSFMRSRIACWAPGACWLSLVIASPDRLQVYVHCTNCTNSKFVALHNF